MRKTKLLDQQESCVFANTQVAASQLLVAVLTINRHNTAVKAMKNVEYGAAKAVSTFWKSLFVCP